MDDITGELDARLSALCDLIERDGVELGKCLQGEPYESYRGLIKKELVLVHECREALRRGW